MAEQPQTRIVSDSEAMQERQRAAARSTDAVDMEAHAKKMDVEGGRYLAEDGKTLIDAEGKPFKAKD